MGKFMQWTAAIVLYLGLSMATFTRNLDPKEGTYVSKGVQTSLTAGAGDKTGTTAYGLDWSVIAKSDAGVKINTSLPASNDRR